MKRITSTFFGAAGLTTAIVGVLALCVWFGYVTFKTYLETPHTYGETTITPYGHHMDGIISHSWDSIKVKNGAQQVTVHDADFRLNIFGDNKGLNVSSSEINVELSAKDSLKETSPPAAEAPQFPEKAKFYLPVNIDVKKLSVQALDKHWDVQGVSIQSEGMQKAHLSIRDISGDYLAHSAKFDLHANFETSDVNVYGTFKAGKDSININGSVPKENLTALKTNVNIEINDPKEWIPAEIPEAVPELGKLQIKAEASLDPKTHKPNYKTNIKTRIGEFWPLMALNVNVKVNGDEDNFHADVHLTNDEGGSIDLEGDFDKNLNGTGNGKVSKMSAMFGPQMMPMDMDIHSFDIHDKKMDVVAETRQGSVVEASMNFENEFTMTYTGDMSPYEPWALDWTKGELVLEDRFDVYGTVSNGTTRILVKIKSVPYCYHVYADSLQTVLLIDKTGIDFSNGIIYTQNETFDFTGDVRWGEKAPHTSWNVTQRNGGHAYAYVSIIDSIAVDITADSVEIATVPFADIKVGNGIDGKVTGHWKQNFDKSTGELEANLTGNVQQFNLSGEIRARQNGDTIFVEKAEATHSKNKVQGEAIFILPNDSNPDFTPTGVFPVQIVHAWASAREFSIPLVLEPLGDTTFASGWFDGNMSFNESRGLQGNVDFSDVEFKNIPSQLFNIKKMNMFAEANKMELNAYLGIGGGGWTGNTQIIVDDLFQTKRHVSISHNSDNGGDLYAEGFIDSTLTFNGQVNMMGSWFVPGTLSEVKNTDLVIDVTSKLRDGLKGITADIHSDKTVYQPPKLDYLFPFKIQGHLENGLLNFSEIETKNDSGETVSATLQYDLDSLILRAIDIHSSRYSIIKGAHKLTAENISGHMEEGLDDLVISGNIGSIHYKFKDENMGEAEAFGKSELSLSIPHSRDGMLQNKTISGNVSIDKLVYHRDLEIEVTPSTLDKFLTLFNNAVAKLRNKETEVKISTADPINLSIHVSDSQNDSIEIVTPFATFPLTFDIWVLGNTNRPLLRGDVTNSNAGFIGVKDIYEFDLNNFRISWTDVPWQHGVVDVSSTQELPYCDEETNSEKETCPVNLDIQGTITNLQPTPSSNCGNESSAASIYYNIFLGCIANQDNETTDWNKLAGKAIGKVISSTANKTLGGDYIGDIDMKVMLFENNTTNEKDSSYFKLPISLDRWVKDLSLIFGYTQDQSENPTYDQSLQFGLNYTLPVFKEKEYSHKNHLSPTMSLFAQLVSKQYLTSTGTENNENRIEKNIGINYVYRYWNPCLLGIGHCETINPNEHESTKPPLKPEAKK